MGMKKETKRKQEEDEVRDVRSSMKEPSLTKEENMSALLSQIEEIEVAYSHGKISFKDKSAQISAIRFRIQDKFNIAESQDERRIIVVPQKHDMICPYTHRECTKMPSKQACMDYYGLIEK